jgi:hypothetical protein
MAFAEFTWVMCCGIGAVVVPILTACFPRVFLKERLESFLWRATERSLLKWGTVLIWGTAVQRYNVIPLMFFPLAALRATFLHYIPLQRFYGSRGRVSHPLICNSCLDHIYVSS